MKLKKLTLKNIRSYESQSLVFPEGSILLSGDIGSGKTSILLAIEFALFGLQPGQRGMSLLRNGKDQGKVSLELEIDDDKITIERTLRRGSKTVSQDSATIEINGTREDLSITELKTKIFTLLNYPTETIRKTNFLYRYTVFSPQEGMKQIILEDPEQRLNVLRHVFGVDKYKKVKENAQIISLKLREKSRQLQIKASYLDEDNDALENSKEKIKKIGAQILEKESILKEKKSTRKEIESALEEVKSKMEEKRKFDNEIEKTRIMVSNKKFRTMQLEEERESTKQKISHEEPKISDEHISQIKKLIDEKKANLEILSEKRIGFKAAINSLELKKEEDLKKKNRIFKIDICPTCLQNVSEVHKHNILNETESLLKKSEKESENYQQELQKIDSTIRDENIILENLTAKNLELEKLKTKAKEFLEAKKDFEKLEKSISLLKNDSKILEDHISSLKQASFDLTKFATIAQEKEAQLKVAFQSEKTVEIQIAESKKEIELLEIEIQNLNKKIKEKEQTSQELSKTLKLEEWISRDFMPLLTFIEQNIMFKLRQEFSSLFNKWFEILTNDTFFVHLDENFTPIILQGEYELDYAFLSGGERTAIALAYRLALNQTINSIFSKIKTSDLVILDEPTDGFSDQQLDKVRDVLQELKISQLLIVSHEQKVESFVDNVIKLQKEGENSVIG